MRRVLFLLLASLALALSTSAQASVQQSPRWHLYEPSHLADTSSWQWTQDEVRHLGLVPPARWLAADPLAEKHPDWTPYNYVLGNPLTLFDPDGRQERAMLNSFDPGTKFGQLEGRFDHEAAKAEAIGALLGAVAFMAPHVALWAAQNPVTATALGDGLAGTIIGFTTDAPIDGGPSSFDDITRATTQTLRRAATHTVITYAGYGGDIALDARRRTSIIGRLHDIDELTSQKGLRILNVPEEIAETADDFFKTYNRDFLKRAIQRGDRIRVVSDPFDPNNLFRTIEETGEILPTFFRKEISFLQTNGYEFNPQTFEFVRAIQNE